MWIFEQEGKVCFIFKNNGEYKFSPQNIKVSLERWTGIVTHTFDNNSYIGEEVEPLKSHCKCLKPHEIIKYKLLGKLPVNVEYPLNESS